jgi:hypothetical protein
VNNQQGVGGRGAQAVVGSIPLIGSLAVQSTNEKGHLRFLELAPGAPRQPRCQAEAGKILKSF